MWTEKKKGPTVSSQEKGKPANDTAKSWSRSRRKTRWVWSIRSLGRKFLEKERGWNPLRGGISWKQRPALSICQDRGHQWINGPDQSDSLQRRLSPYFRLPCWLRQERICLQCRRPGFNPWVGKSPWRAWQPTPVSFLGKSHGQKSLVGYSLWRCKESDMTEQLTLLSPYLADSRCLINI